MTINEKKGYLYLFIGYIFATIAHLVVGYSFQSYPNLEAFDTGVYGMAGALFLISPYFLFSKKRSKAVKAEWKRNKKTLLKISILIFFGYLLWLYAFKNGTASIIGFVKRLDVIISFFLGILLLKEKFSSREFIFVGISIIGFTWVSNLEGEITQLASIALAISALCYSLQSYIVKKNILEMCSKSFAYLRLVLVVLLLVIAAVITGNIKPLSIEIILILSIGQIFGAFVYRDFYFKAHKYLPISKIAFFSLCSPVMIFITSILILNESVSPEKIAGFSIILIGILLFLGEKFRLNRKQKLNITNNK